MRQVRTWGHVALHQGVCRVTCGGGVTKPYIVRCIEELRDPRSMWVPRAPGGWALHPLIPRRVLQDPLQGVVP